MSLLNGLLGQLAGNVDVENLAQRVGISPELAEQAIQALGVAHYEPGDTAETAAASTGLPLDQIQQIIGHIGHIGGEGSLGQFADMLKSRGGDLLGGLLNRE